MPLTNDNEYNEVMESVKSEMTTTFLWSWWIRVLSIGSLIFFSIWWLEHSNLSDTAKIMGTVGVCTICLVATIVSLANLIRGALVTLVASTEWVGRKQLGEYEPPA